MAEFIIRSERVCLLLDQFEAELLRLLLDQLVDLLDEGEPDRPADPDDPFAAWERSFEQADLVAGAEFEDLDPITRRLFPDAYRDDPHASLDFRRYTQSEQRAAKVSQALQVIDDLDRLEPAGRVVIPDEHLQAWMKTLNTMRLVISVVLGITDEISSDEVSKLPDTDPRTPLYQYYGWLGWLLESLMDCAITRG